MISHTVRRLLAEAALRAEIGDANYEHKQDFWESEIKNELMVLDSRTMHVPSADAHDSTCAASSKFKEMVKVLR